MLKTTVFLTLPPRRARTRRSALTRLPRRAETTIPRSAAVARGARTKPGEGHVPTWPGWAGEIV